MKDAKKTETKKESKENVIGYNTVYTVMEYIIGLSKPIYHGEFDTKRQAQTLIDSLIKVNLYSTFKINTKKIKVEVKENE